MNISGITLRRLRIAIQNNEVSFPSQVPIFPRQSRVDIQWRLVELYFIHNWSSIALGERYQITMERVRQLISQWVRRAAVLGYLEEIPRSSLPLEEGAQAQESVLASPVTTVEAAPGA